MQKWDHALEDLKRLQQFIDESTFGSSLQTLQVNKDLIDTETNEYFGIIHILRKHIFSILIPTLFYFAAKNMADPLVFVCIFQPPKRTGFDY